MSLAFVRTSSQDLRESGLDTALKLTGVMTAACKFKPAGDYVNPQALMSCQISGATQGCYRLEFGVTDNKFTFKNASGAIHLTSTTSISTDAERSIMITRTGSSGNWNLAFFLDGVADGTATGVTGNPLTSASQKFVAGQLYGAAAGNSGTNGRLSELALWDVGDITAAEAMAYARGISPLLIRPASLIEYWPVYGRQSPEPGLTRGLDLTLTNAPTYADHPRIIRARQRFWQVPAAGGGINAALTLTEEADSVASTGTVAIAATLAQTEADDSVASDAAVATAASLSVVEQDDAIEATASSGEISASLAVTEDDDRIVASATAEVAATLSATEEGDTVSASATAEIAAVAAIAEDSDTLSAQASASLAALLAVIEEDDYVAATGYHDISAALAAAEENDLLVAAATVTAPSEPVTNAPGLVTVTSSGRGGITSGTSGRGSATLTDGPRN